MEIHLSHHGKLQDERIDRKGLAMSERLAKAGAKATQRMNTANAWQAYLLHLRTFGPSSGLSGRDCARNVVLMVVG